MKALGILKEGLDFMNKAIKVNPNSIKELQSEIDRYVEAIKELEELNNRSCDGCKTTHCPVKKVLVENDYISSNYFYCNDWEIKEIKNDI